MTTNYNGFKGAKRQHQIDREVRMQTALELSLDGKTPQEIAALLKVSLQTVYGYIGRPALYKNNEPFPHIKITAMVTQKQFDFVTERQTTERGFSSIMREALQFAIEKGFT